MEEEQEEEKQWVEEAEAWGCQGRDYSYLDVGAAAPSWVHGQRE